jgi:hypothetical protein
MNEEDLDRAIETRVSERVKQAMSKQSKIPSSTYNSVSASGNASDSRSRKAVQKQMKEDPVQRVVSVANNMRSSSGAGMRNNW